MGERAPKPTDAEAAAPVVEASHHDADQPVASIEGSKLHSSPADTSTALEPPAGSVLQPRQTGDESAASAGSSLPVADGAIVGELVSKPEETTRQQTSKSQTEEQRESSSALEAFLEGAADPFSRR